jgi:hypothetical protein
MEYYHEHILHNHVPLLLVVIEVAVEGDDGLLLPARLPILCVSVDHIKKNLEFLV